MKIAPSQCGLLRVFALCLSVELEMRVAVEAEAAGSACLTTTVGAVRCVPIQAQHLKAHAGLWAVQGIRAAAAAVVAASAGPAY